MSEGKECNSPFDCLSEFSTHGLNKKTEHHDIAEILLKVVLNAITLTPFTSTVEFISCKSNYHRSTTTMTP
jgi:uncharacterized CHY-type Zn-finger protein